MKQLTMICEFVNDDEALRKFDAALKELVCVERADRSTLTIWLRAPEEQP